MPASDVRIGTPVFSSDGVEVGHVSAVRVEMFKVESGRAWPAYWLPQSAVAEAGATGVRLLHPQDKLKDLEVRDVA